jgi:hypothetical protein
MIRRVYRRRFEPIARNMGIHTTLKSLYRRSSPGYYLPFIDRSELRERADRCYHFGGVESVSIARYDAPAGVRTLGSPENLAGTYHFEQPYVAEVHGARILPEMGVAATPDGTIILETANSYANRISGFFQYRPRYSARLLYQQWHHREPSDSFDIETAVSLVRTPNEDGGRKTGFSQWLTGYLTRLAGISHYAAETGRQPTIILEENPHSWMVESLALFGFGDDIVYWDPDEELTVERLVVPSVRRIEQATPTCDTEIKIPSSQAGEWLRREATRRTRDLQGRFPSRIYLSRADAQHRKVANREEILDVLEPLGYEAYELATLPVREQVALFTSVDSVVAPHGAGLANMFFASDCTVTELVGDVLKPTYYLMAQSLGHSHQYVAGTTVEHPDLPLIHSDVRIDPDELLDTLQ